MTSEYYGAYIVLNEDDASTIDRLHIHLPLKAAPKGSWTTFVRNGKAITKPANDRERKVAKQITEAIQHAIKDGAGLHEKDKKALEYYGAISTKDPYAVEVTFKFDNKNRQIQKTTMPDLDKLLRSINDAITKTGCLWVDDSQVCSIKALKQNASRDEIILDVSRVDPSYYPEYKVMKEED